MASVSSPPEEIVELLGKRQLSVIPKDQRALLEDPDSWAIGHGNARNAEAIVPDHVLETVRETYINRAVATQGSQPRPQPTAQSRQTDSSPTTSRKGSTHNGFLHTQTPNCNTNSPPPSSPEVRMSWSPSPERPQPKRMVVESSIVKETPKAPMGPPPRPAVMPSFPSSDEDEEDLETELPQAQAQRDPPINRTAAKLQAAVDSPIKSANHPMDTPPCAQPSHPTPRVIPNSLDAQNRDDSDVQGDHLTEQRRGRRMKAIHFNERTPKKNLHVKNRLAPTKTFAPVPSSVSTSPSSIIPATYEEPRTPGLVLESVENAKDIELADREESPDQNDNPLEARVQESSIQVPATSSNVPLQTSQPSQESILDGTSPPYDIFKMAYPEYEENFHGTLWDFVKSCVSLDYLRRTRQLRECLYDDFIRAFLEFKSYVGNARFGQEPLPAIEWFSRLPGPPIFHRMVITNDNIGYVLDSYPKLVEKIGQLIHKNPEEEIIEGMKAGSDLRRVSEPVVTEPVPRRHETDLEVESIEQLPVQADSDARSRAGRVDEAPANVDLNNAMDIDSGGQQPQPSSTPPLTSATRQQEVLTQAPPPPSPFLSSTALPSTMATPSIRKPRSSRYFAKLSAMASTNDTPRRRSADEQARLRAHFLQRRSASTRSVRSSSKPT